MTDTLTDGAPILTEAGVPITTGLMMKALFEPELFDLVYEASLNSARMSRGHDPFAFVHRRMAEEIHFWRSAAGAELQAARLHLQTMRQGGVVADPGSPEQQIEEAERVVRGHIQDLRDVFDYAFLPVSMPSGAAIRVGDPVIDTEEDGPMLVGDVVKDHALHVVGAQIPLDLESFARDGDPPPPGFITVRAALDDMTLQQIKEQVENGAELLKLCEAERGEEQVEV